MRITKREIFDVGDKAYFLRKISKGYTVEEGTIVGIGIDKISWLDQLMKINFSERKLTSKTKEEAWQRASRLMRENDLIESSNSIGRISNYTRPG